MLEYSVPPGYRRQVPPRRPKLSPYAGVIDCMLEDDHQVPRKQRRTAKRIYERIRDEYEFDGGYTIVKDYVREHRCQISITTTVQGGMAEVARRADRRLAWEWLARSLLHCVCSSHLSSSSGPNRSLGSIPRTTL